MKRLRSGSVVRSENTTPKPLTVSQAERVDTPNRGATPGLRARLLQRLRNQTHDDSVAVPDTTIDDMGESLRLIGELLEEEERQCIRAPDSSFYGLPRIVGDIYRTHRKITSLYEWQEECSRLVLRGTNVVYTSPTSGGKTIVSEMAVFNHLLQLHRDAVLVLPYVSLVDERLRQLRPFALALGFALEEYAGGKGTFPPMKKRRRRSLYVCTIEKTASLVNYMIEEKREDELGVVVVDELHMVGEGERGALLEVTLLKLINLPELATFLHADTYVATKRPTDLTEMVKMEGSLYTVDLRCEDLLKPCRDVPNSQPTRDPDGLLSLVAETSPCLVFCATKKQCENVATLLVDLMDQSYSETHVLERRQLLDQMKLETGGHVCPLLKVARAKQLSDAGFRTLAQLADTQPESLSNLITHLPRRTAARIIEAARVAVREKAAALLEQMEELLESDVVRKPLADATITHESGGNSGLAGSAGTTRVTAKQSSASQELITSTDSSRSDGGSPIIISQKRRRT